MFSNNSRRLLGLTLGLLVCLMAPACRTSRTAEQAAGECPASSAAIDNTIRKLNEIIIPEMTFFAPAMIIDVVDFLNRASREYDKSRGAQEKEGVAIELRLPGLNTGPDAKGNAPVIQALSLRSVSLYDALKVLCETTGLTFRIRGDDGRVMIVPHYGDEGWAIRSYSVPQALYDRLFNSHDGQTSAADPNKVWQAFFEELGVTGPECARFEYLPVINKLRVTNTPENLAIIEQVVDAFALRMVEVEVQIHAFRAQDIERLRLSGGVSLEKLTALRKEGKSKPVATTKALTKSGQEATAKAVREVRYPTELLMDDGQAGSNVTSRSAVGTFMPGCFETRETGMTLQVVSEVALGASEIRLLLNPCWVTQEGWESYPVSLAQGLTHKTIPFKQPIFGVTSFQTQLAVRDGETVLLGSSSTPDEEWVHIGFLAVRLRDVQPRLANGSVDKAKPKIEEPSPEIALKLREIVIPEMTFRPPATIVDAVKFFKEASVTYDESKVPMAQRGIDFVLKLQTGVGRGSDPFAAPAAVGDNSLPVISALSARYISLHDALKLVCDVTGLKFRIRDGVVWILPVEAPEGELISRVYPVLSSLCERIGGADGGHADDASRMEGLRILFGNMGVKWPDGSSIRYLSSVGLLRVTNTPANLAVFEQVLDDLTVHPQMVEVEAQIHAFRSEDIERLRLVGGVSVEALTALRKEGKSTPVASASVITKSGQEAVAKSVREILYPTQPEADNEPGALIPCNFRMREVGLILRVEPEFSSDDVSQIHLMVNPNWVTLDRWESHPADLTAESACKTLPFRQPVFGATSWQTQVMVKDGGTVLLGSSATPDGKWVQVGFLTARRVNTQAENQPE